MKMMDTQIPVYTTKRIIHSNYPILTIIHDNDGDWQFLDGLEINDDDIFLVSFQEILQHDDTLLEVIQKLHVGMIANRTNINSAWIISGY